MIYGIVPVGGAGTRLGLPFPKELLPLKNKNSYYPVSQHTVDNLLEAGCDIIFFVHGTTYKKELVQFYSKENYIHILNPGNRQSEIFLHFYNAITPQKNDVYLYGLPDSYYPGNLFCKMKDLPGVVCGMFEAEDHANVDRLNEKKKFIKSIRDSNLSVECWGVLKFDYMSMQMFTTIIQNSNFEVADSINNLNFELCYGQKYFDLGTWDALNSYWNNA